MSATCPGYTCPTGTSANDTLRIDFVGGAIELIKNTPSLSASYQSKLTSAAPWSQTELETITTALLAQNTALTGYNRQQADGSVLTPVPYRDLTGLANMRIYESFDPAVEIDITQLRTAYSAMESGLQNEYCYYLGRYQCAINDYIDRVSILQTGATVGADVMMSLQTAQQLNFKLATILAVYSVVVTKLKTTVASSSTIYDTLNQRIRANQTALAGQATTTLRSVLDTQKEMIAYTEEKNKQTRNQLILYGGLNAVALGLLVWMLR